MDIFADLLNVVDCYLLAESVENLGNMELSETFECLLNLINQLLDFMIEMIQGPMKSNQSQLSDTKFLETLKDFIEEYNNKFIAGENNNKSETKKFTNQISTITSSEDRNVSIEKKVKADIIIKSVQLMNDILEGNSQDKTMFNKMDILDTTLLMEILFRQFEHYLLTKVDNAITNPIYIAQTLRKRGDELSNK